MRRRASGPIRRWSPPIIAFGAVAGWSTTRGRVVSHARRSVSLQPDAAAAVGQPASHACRAGGGQRRAPGRRRGTLTVGVEGGGDWIRSTNLGDHSTARVSGFGEWRQDIGRARAARRDAFASIATTSSAPRGTRRRHRLVAGIDGSAARVGGSRLPRADVHRALLLGSGEPGARGGRSRDRVGG